MAYNRYFYAILIVGTTEFYSLQSSLARALRKLGCDVRQWNNREPGALFGWRNWWSLNRLEREAYSYEWR